MKKPLKFWISFVVLFLSGFCISLQAQEKVTGTVISLEDGEPLIGAHIVIEGTNIGTVTDINGKFNISASRKSTLLIRHIEMETKRVPVTSSVLNITMKPRIRDLDEVVVIGYGTQKKKELTGAVSQIKSEELSKLSTADIGTALQGLVAGVTVTASSGAPGATANVQIRGIASVNGSNEPLYIVDGIPQNGDPRLSSNEIETIDILKDAASAAVYGTRGAGGVILITTKKGKSGQMKVSLDANFGFQKITSGIPLQNFEEHIYTRMVNYRNNENGIDGENYTPLTGNPQGYFNNTNLMSTLQNDNAPVQNYSVNLSGGKDFLTYNFSANYYNQKGILINSGYDRLNLRGNTSMKKGKWDFFTSLGVSLENRKYEPWQLLYEAYRYNPFKPEIDPSVSEIRGVGVVGNPETFWIRDMLVKLKQSDSRKGNNFNINTQLSYKIIEQLTATVRVGGGIGNGIRRLVNPDVKVYYDDGSEVTTSYRSKVRYTTDKGTNFALEGSLNYQQKFGDHQLKGTAMMSMERYTSMQYFAEKFDLANDQIVVLNGATSDPNVGSSGWDFATAMTGFLARVQYDWKGRYLLTAGTRVDGSSRFAKSNRYGVFPSVSLGWNIADENFFKSLTPWWNAFKLRASYGTTGNQNFSDYSYASTINVGYDYVFNGAPTTLTRGMTQVGYANPNVKWETSLQQNIGVDMAFLDNKLTFSADFYNTKKQDMLFPLLLPTSSGAPSGSSVVLNVGDMNNKGVELSLGYRQRGKITWSVNSTFTKNVNKVTKMSGANKQFYFSSGYLVDGGDYDRVTTLREGYEAGAFFVMPTNGIVNTDEKLAEYQKLVPTARKGDLMYVDADKNGSIDDNDRVYGGSGTPSFEMGLSGSISYKNFDLSMQWYASVGNEVINGGKLYAYQYNMHRDLVYQWGDHNPNSLIPAYRGWSHANARGYADVWVEDGSFVRLRNVTFSYSLPRKILSKVKIDKVRIYVAADNPLTLTKYNGFDPEVGNDGLASRGLDRGNYPVASNYRLGVQLEF